MLVQKFKKAAKVEMTGMVTLMAIIALMNDVSSKLSWVNAKENTLAAKELLVHLNLIRAQKRAPNKQGGCHKNSLTLWKS